MTPKKSNVSAAYVRRGTGFNKRVGPFSQFRVGDGFTGYTPLPPPKDPPHFLNYNNNVRIYSGKLY